MHDLTTVKFVFRLSPGVSAYSRSLLEVFNGGLWGVVCGDGWDLRDAHVACREMGFNL